MTFIQRADKYLVHCTPLINFGATEDIQTFFTILFCIFIISFYTPLLTRENQTSIEKDK